MSVGIGSQVAGIRLVSLIGQGGMALVYLGKREGTGEELVVKVLRDEYARDDQIRRRFTRESRYASSLEHPHIVRIVDSGETDGLSYIVMHYVLGQDLRKRLAVDGPLGPAETISILSQVADALDTAHDAGLWHRDVKPGNVLIASGQGPEPRGHCYLTDFGLSKQPSRDSRGLTAPGEFVGSVLYAAPEEMLGEETDQTIDVYSLGCVLHECLVGRPPFEGVAASDVMQAHIEAQPPKPSKQRPDLPSEFDAVLHRALAKRPGDRYRTCGELIEAACQALGVVAAEPIRAPALVLTHASADPGEDEIPVVDELVIGRGAPDLGQAGSDTEMSRRHARIARSPDGAYLIEDLGSRNGTFVNEHLVEEPQMLHTGDRIRVGGTTFGVHLQPREAASQISLRLEFDFEASEARIQLGGSSPSIRITRDRASWRLAAD